MFRWGFWQAQAQSARCGPDIGNQQRARRWLRLDRAAGAAAAAGAGLAALTAGAAVRDAGVRGVLGHEEFPFSAADPMSAFIPITQARRRHYTASAGDGRS